MSEPISRRRALQLAALGAASSFVAPAFAQGFGPASSQGGQGGQSGMREFRIDEANIRPRPIAVPDFVSSDPRLGADIAAVLLADLERSGLFKPVAPAAFPERFRAVTQVPRTRDWSAAGAEALLIGGVAPTSDGRIQVEYRLWDTELSKNIDGKRYTLGQWRRLAHIVADQVYSKLTLEKGYFDTQIVFIDETGPKDRRVKRLAVMDQDGANVRLLTRGGELVLTPRFSPVSQEITYMTYVGQTPRVMLMNLSNGKQQQVGNLPGMTFAPRFSPDGQRILMSFGQSGASSIVEMDLRSSQARQLTQMQWIDTGACYAPDGRQIVFESDREGTQQLYVMGNDGSGTRRLSVGEGRYSTPVWSPRGDYIAFTKQLSGRFLIGVLKPDGTGERILTAGFHNEGPTWAPNGRVLMFFRDSQGANGGPHLYSIDVTGYNERRVPTPSFASDPAWSPLLT
ncbi:MAG: Tol-Pal system beta propeller repeat protein TolB [Hyphomicrobiaceae bacterium]